MSMDPVFIHSLFRSGSTYIFHAFRRAEPRYCCYQEALHERAFIARDNPELLDDGFENRKMALLRHPRLSMPYFQELHNAWPSWKGTIRSSAIYDEYFAPSNADLGLSYWRSLIAASLDRPVFQECRTSGRIGAIRNQLGGYHIYLWRNPWDQWWSYKVASYFDLSSQLIINASICPDVVKRLRSRIGFQPFEGNDVEAAISHFSKHPLGSEESYLIFYLLWCLGLEEGIRHANLLLNIDCLSDSPAYREEVALQLNNGGIVGLDFSDCHVPQSYYQECERAFFVELESEVHEWLAETGWSQHELDSIQSLREQFLPASCRGGISAADGFELAGQLAQTRALILRLQSSAADHARTAHSAIAQAEARAQQAEARAQQAEARAQQAEARAQQVEARAQQVEVRAQQVNILADSYYFQLQALLTSKSWLITEPLRRVFDLISVRSRALKPRGNLPNGDRLASMSPDLQGLTPRACEIYEELVKSIEEVRRKRP